MRRVGILHRPQSISDKVDSEGWPLVPATLLSVHRTYGEDEGTRQIIVNVDGERICQLVHGQRCTRELLPGPHTLRVHNTLFWKTIPFVVEPGGHVHFTVWNRSWGAAFYFYIMFIGPPPLLLGVAKGPPDAMRPVEDAAADSSLSLPWRPRRGPLL